MRKLQATVLFTLAILSGSHCLAATPVSAAKTKEFHEAYAAFTANDSAKAYKILSALVTQTPAYDAIGLLGQTELTLGKYRDAAEHLTFAIQNTPSGKAESALPPLKEDLGEAKTHITTLWITVTQPDAEVMVDSKVVGKSPIDVAVFMDPGKHTISASHPTHGNAESTLDAKPGEEKAVALKLEKQTKTSPPALKYTPDDLDKPSKITVNPPPPVEPKSGMEGRTIVLIAGSAVTLVAAGTATYFGFKSRSLGKDADSMATRIEGTYGNNACAAPTGGASGLCADFLGKRNDQRDAGRIANVSFVVAGVAAAATGLTYLLWPRAKTATSAFVMAPITAPNAGGLILQGNF